MSRWGQHGHRCPECGKLFKCKYDCTLTDKTTKPIYPDRPVGPTVHGGSGAMRLGGPKLCSRCGGDRQ